MEKSDPYIDSNTGVLKNLLNIKDNNKLKQAESDIVITRIHEIFKTMYFESSKDYFLELHKYLFSDVYSFAGKYRTIEIYKQERVLAYESVEYAKPSEIDYQLNEIFEILRNTDLLSLDIEMQKDFVTSLISDLWKVHPFREGNTRTTALFIEKYLVSLGYGVDNTMFKEKSVYYRNALVRSNYFNNYLNIKEDNSFLIKFYENLLLGKNNNLHSKDLIVEELFNKEN